MRLSPEVAEDQGGSVLGCQPTHFLIDDRPELGRLLRRHVKALPHPRRLSLPRRGPSPLALPASPGLYPCARRDPMGDAVEPCAQHVVIADRTGLLDQDEERGLEGIFRIVRFGQPPAADAEHHWAMALEDRLERGLVTPREEALQELRLAQPRQGPVREQSLDVRRNRTVILAAHGHPSSPPETNPRSC